MTATQRLFAPRCSSFAELVQAVGPHQGLGGACVGAAMQAWKAPTSLAGCKLRQSASLREEERISHTKVEGWWFLCRMQEQAASVPMTLAKAVPCKATHGDSSCGT